MPPLERADHEAFCLAYVASNDQVSAYKSAFKRCKSDGGARVNAIKLRSREDVIERIEELRQQAAHAQRDHRAIALEQKAIISAESLIADADWLMQQAASSEQYSAAVSALRLKAQLAGVLKDTKSPTENVVNNVALFIDAPPQETYDQWVARRRRIAGSLEPPRRPTNGRDYSDVVQ